MIARHFEKLPELKDGQLIELLFKVAKGKGSGVTRESFVSMACELGLVSCEP
jgi:hypothetical protein